MEKFRSLGKQLKQFYANYFEALGCYEYNQKNNDRELSAENVISITTAQQFYIQSEENHKADIDNLIQKSVAENSNQQKENEFMRLNKNTRKRSDGRFEWRCMINGKTHSLIHRNLNELAKMVCEYKKINLKINIHNKIKESRKLIDIAWAYYYRNIESQVAKKKMTMSSAERYTYPLKKHLVGLNKNIETYTKDDIIDFFNGITAHRNGHYCYLLLRRIFADEKEKGNIKINPMASLENPFPISRCVTKGTWINLDGQSEIFTNKDKPFAKEAIFYLMTGARLSEAFNTRIDFDRSIAHITREKTKKYGVTHTAVPLSKDFCDFIKDEWDKMFKSNKNIVGKGVSEFLKSLGINKSAHSLRHTFSSNIYYLGTDAKKHQYLMAHSSIQMTYDTYTTLDMSVRKQDIIKIWGKFYPQF